MDKVAKSVRPLTRRETPENLGVVGKVACPPRFRPAWGGDGSEVNVYQLLTARQSVIAIDAVPDTVRISGSARDWGAKSSLVYRGSWTKAGASRLYSMNSTI